MSEHGHHHPATGSADRRWLGAALAILTVFMCAEVIAGVAAHSLALLTDAGHMLTDVVGLVVALVAVSLLRRPARGAFTYGFARVDALAGQVNGITLVLLAVWFSVSAVRHLVDPPAARGSVLAVVAGIGVVVNVVVTALASRADRRQLSVQGAVSHLVNDIWAFGCTAVAGVVIIATHWTRADAVASLVIAALMAWSGISLLRAAGRIFLEAAPAGVDPGRIGAELAAVDGVVEVHDLHVWQLGPEESAVSAHVLVCPPYDCHAVGASLRQLLHDRHGLAHATLQIDHVGTGIAHDAHCADAHGPVHVSADGSQRDAMQA